MPRQVTNYDFIGSMIPIMHCNSRIQPLLVLCLRNINFCLIHIHYSNAKNYICSRSVDC